MSPHRWNKISGALSLDSTLLQHINHYPGIKFSIKKSHLFGALKGIYSRISE